MPTTPRQSEPINGSEYQASPDNRLTTLGVVAARLDVECQLAATTSRAKAQGRSDRSALPIEVVHQHRGLAAGAPRSNARRGQRDTRLVEEADDGLAAPGVFLILGQSAARRRRSSNAWGSRRSAAGLRRVAIGLVLLSRHLSVTLHRRTLFLGRRRTLASRTPAQTEGAIMSPGLCRSCRPSPAVRRRGRSRLAPRTLHVSLQRLAWHRANAKHSAGC